MFSWFKRLLSILVGAPASPIKKPAADREEVFFFVIEKRELKITSSTYSVVASSPEEAREKFWLYWCGEEIDGKEHPLVVPSIHVDELRHKARCVENSMMNDREAQILAEIITGTIKDPSKFAYIQRIIEPMLKKNARTAAL